MLPDSTVSDTKKPRKKRKSGGSEDTDAGPVRKSKKKSSAPKKKTLKRKTKKKSHSAVDDESFGSDIDLSKELYPMSHYIKDRRELVREMFSSLSRQKLKSMLPDILKKYTLEEMEEFCCGHIEIMSRKRINELIKGTRSEDISSSEAEELSSGEETEDNDIMTIVEKIDLEPPDSTGVEIVLPNVDDELERVKPHTIAVAMANFKDCDQWKCPRVASEQLHYKNVIGANIKPINKQKLELLELEMRARAIKKMLASQQQNEEPTHTSKEGADVNPDDKDAEKYRGKVTPSPERKQTEAVEESRVLPVNTPDSPIEIHIPTAVTKTENARKLVTLTGFKPRDYVDDSDEEGEEEGEISEDDHHVREDREHSHQEVSDEEEEEEEEEINQYSSSNYGLPLGYHADSHLIRQEEFDEVRVAEKEAGEYQLSTSTVTCKPRGTRSAAPEADYPAESYTEEAKEGQEAQFEQEQEGSMDTIMMDGPTDWTQWSQITDWSQVATWSAMVPAAPTTKQKKKPEPICSTSEGHKVPSKKAVKKYSNVEGQSAAATPETHAKESEAKQKEPKIMSIKNPKTKDPDSDMEDGEISDKASPLLEAAAKSTADDRATQDIQTSNDNAVVPLGKEKEEVKNEAGGPSAEKTDTIKSTTKPEETVKAVTTMNAEPKSKNDNQTNDAPQTKVPGSSNIRKEPQEKLQGTKPKPPVVDDSAIGDVSSTPATETEIDRQSSKCENVTQQQDVTCESPQISESSRAKLSPAELMCTGAVYDEEPPPVADTQSEIGIKTTTTTQPCEKSVTEDPNTIKDKKTSNEVTGNTADVMEPKTNKKERPAEDIFASALPDSEIVNKSDQSQFKSDDISALKSDEGFPVVVVTTNESLYDDVPDVGTKLPDIPLPDEAKISEHGDTAPTNSKNEKHDCDDTDEQSKKGLNWCDTLDQADELVLADDDSDSEAPGVSLMHLPTGEISSGEDNELVNANVSSSNPIDDITGGKRAPTPEITAQRYRNRMSSLVTLSPTIPSDDKRNEDDFVGKTKVYNSASNAAGKKSKTEKKSKGKKTETKKKTGKSSTTSKGDKKKTSAKKKPSDKKVKITKEDQACDKTEVKVKDKKTMPEHTKDKEKKVIGPTWKPSDEKLKPKPLSPTQEKTTTKVAEKPKRRSRSRSPAKKLSRKTKGSPPKRPTKSDTRSTGPVRVKSRSNSTSRSPAGRTSSKSKGSSPKRHTKSKSNSPLRSKSPIRTNIHKRQTKTRSVSRSCSQTRSRTRSTSREGRKPSTSHGQHKKSHHRQSISRSRSRSYGRAHTRSRSRDRSETNKASHRDPDRRRMSSHSPTSSSRADRGTQSHKHDRKHSNRNYDLRGYLSSNDKTDTDKYSMHDTREYRDRDNDVDPKRFRAEWEPANNIITQPSRTVIQTYELVPSGNNRRVTGAGSREKPIKLGGGIFTRSTSPVRFPRTGSPDIQVVNPTGQVQPELVVLSDSE